eukprot:sb/3462865/
MCDTQCCLPPASSAFFNMNHSLSPFFPLSLSFYLSLSLSLSLSLLLSPPHSLHSQLLCQSGGHPVVKVTIGGVCSGGVMLRRTLRLCSQNCNPRSKEDEAAVLAAEEEDSRLNQIEERTQTKKKRKVQFYKAKFDTRITAKYEIKAVKVRVVRRVFSQNLVDERGVPSGPLERYRKFPILSRSLVMTQGRDTKIWYPGYFLTLNTMQASISIQNEPIFRIGNFRYLSSGPDGTPRSSTKFCEKTRRATLTLTFTNHWGNCNPEIEERTQTKKKRKVQFYKAKFDTRITAKYEIKALIGRGSFSRVVRVKHHETQEPFAIKVVALSQSNRTTFNTEVMILRQVRHPYIIRLYDVVQTRERLYMVMELATGGELFDRIVSRGYYTEQDASHTISMILEGLHYLHKLGIAHRDMKPENLLYYHPGPDSKIMITDFGLSAYKRHDEPLNTTCGTPEYIAPEILKQEPYTCGVDLWAVGVITFILLCGRMPFDEENRARLYKQILRAKYSFDGDPWGDVSTAAKHFIQMLICKDPKERLTAEEALLHPWIQESIFYTRCINLHHTVSSNILRQRGWEGVGKSGEGDFSQAQGVLRGNNVLHQRKDTFQFAKINTCCTSGHQEKGCPSQYGRCRFSRQVSREREIESMNLKVCG